MDDCDMRMCGECYAEGTGLQNEIAIEINQFEKIYKTKKMALICAQQFKKTKRLKEKIRITRRIKQSFVMPKFIINDMTPIFHTKQNTNIKHCQFPEISVMTKFHHNLVNFLNFGRYYWQVLVLFLAVVVFVWPYHKYSFIKKLHKVSSNITLIEFVQLFVIVCIIWGHVIDVYIR